MEWKTVAKGTSFDDLHPTVGDLRFSKGQRVRYVFTLRLPLAFAFDLPAAETAFKSRIPPGFTLVDVSGEGASQVIVELEADPAWLLATLAFVKVHWIAITISTLAISVVLGTIVTAIRVETPGEVVKTGFMTIVIIAALIVIGLVIITTKGKIATPTFQVGG